MCVIVGMEKQIPSLGILKQCETANKDGGGISWVENGRVHWKKGITADEIHDIATHYGLGCVAHFRISTIGGVPPELTHPFPISKTADTTLTGSASRVLFHNGIWSDWEKSCFQMVLNTKAYFPKGPWSDSRAMAWLVHHTNSSLCRFVGGRVLIHTAKERMYFGGFTEENGVWYSNMNWKPREYDATSRDIGLYHANWNGAHNYKWPQTKEDKDEQDRLFKELEGRMNSPVANI